MFLNPCLPPTKIRKTAKIQSCSFNEQETTPNLNNFMVSSTNSMSSSKSEPKKVKSSSNFTELSNNSQKNQISNLPIDDNSNFFAKFPQNTRLSNQNLKNHPFRNLIFSPEVTVEKLNNYISLIQRGLIYSRTCLKQPSAAYLKNKSINLSEKKSNL